MATEADKLRERLKTIEDRYQRICWNALQALSVYEEYLLDQKTSNEVARVMRTLFDDIPDSLGELELGDFTEA